ncbi:MAG: glycoside hydrolase family 3 C-terminal domain-containing protein [Bacteroidales bacterium]
MKKISFFVFIAFFALNLKLLAQKKYEFPFQDPNLTIDERVNDLISRMTLQEKALQLFNGAPAIERLGVPAYNWWNECLHGVARAGKATVFPQAIGMAATFDQDLMLQIGTAISDEGRAKHHNFFRNNVHSIYTGLTFWSPNINIFRDPRWGRGQETYGEDPYLTGRMAVNFINGLQGNDPKYFKTIATAKHYAVHSGPEFSRHIDNIFINDRDLYETYLPAFRATVKEAHVQSVMCAYNRFRDKPCCGSDLLLNDILRNQYGFDGYIVSDCGAISDFYNKNTHHVVETPSRAWGWSLASGTDLNCEENKAFIENDFENAVKNGVINEKDINEALKKLFKARFKLGMFDPEEMVPYSKIPMSVVGSEEHLKLSLTAAEKSLVLLKNNGILPLKNVKKIALIGPNANNPSILIGNYNGDPINPITPLKGLQTQFGKENVLYSAGCPIVPGVFTDFEIVNEENLFHLEKGKLAKGLKAEYFQDPDLKGTPKITRIDKNIDFVWPLSPINQLLDEAFGVRWTGVIVPVKSGKYVFSTNLQLKVDDKTVPAEGISLEKGKQYKLEAIFSLAGMWWTNNHQQQFANLSWTDASKDLKTEALQAAKLADVIVFCGGISANLEGEEMPLEIEGFSHGDRTSLDLPKIQEELLKELQKTGKPIVYVNFSGSAISLNWENENLPALVQAFYPGEATGTALANLLSGKINPSGRLPVTFYKSVNDLPDFKNYVMEGRTYRYFKGEPLYPFGFGLSYTSFKYANVQAIGETKTGKDIKVKVQVENTGDRDGEEVVQVYVEAKDATVPVPIHALCGFKRVSIKSGESQIVEIVLKAESFSVIDKDYNRVIEPGKYNIYVGGFQPEARNIANGQVLSTLVNLTGEKVVLKD